MRSRMRTGAKSWMMDGMRHDQELSRCPEPNEDQAATIEPTYHKVLKNLSR